MRFDLVVLGAGPAGMAAATVGAQLGLSTLLLDEQQRVGGQIYRNIECVSPRVSAVLGPDYQRGRSLVEALRASDASVRHGATVWDVSPDLCVTGLQEGRVFQVQAGQLIAATGAMERASPIPGWTLPGVMNAGAAQIAIKGDALVPQGRVALVGGGPLVLLVACQLLKAGAELVALVETSERCNHLAALRHLPAALRRPGYLLKGMTMASQILRARVPWYRGAVDLELAGQDHVRSLSFRTRKGHSEVQLDAVLLHHGVIPNTQISRLLRVEHVWSDAQMCWHVRCDEFGQTSLPGFRVAGDGASIAGAIAAQLSGALAALGAAHAMGRIDTQELSRRSAPLQRELARERAIRPFLDALYRPPAAIACPSDETIVCRCEEVTAGRIREMARLGCVGPNQTKFLSRCGMGPCQGRICGNVVTQVLAETLGRSPEQVGAYRIRSPLKPVPLASIANLHIESNPATRT